ncbi:DUF5667 domain-containing protein [Egicoccus sp. AB-alg6-2]|uniref:DUF5667 domain-containing protein n=1 Tax=Egicoccus sp. AB-alg6-2 TaxID=3242692 RepID=UPI00359E5074
MTPRRHAREIEQLAALLDGTRAPGEVDGATRSLGRLATAVVEHDAFESVTLSQANREAMRARLLADIANERPETAPAPARPSRQERFRSTRVGIATGLASAMLGSAGVAFAAQDALPGDTLYRVKQATETARLSLAGDVVQHGRLQLRFAEERLDEVATGSDRLGSDRLTEALAEMDQRSLDGAQDLIAAAERTADGELLAEVDAFTQRQASRLVEIYDALPAEVRPRAEDSLGVLRRIRLELLFPVAQACDCVALADNGVVPLGGGATLAERLRSAALPAPTASPDRSRLSEGLAEAEAAAVARVEGTLGESTGSDDGGVGRSPSTTSGGTGTGDAVAGVTGSAGQTIEDTGSRVGGTVRDTADEVGDAVGGVVGGEAGDAVDETVDEVGDGLGQVVEDVGGTIGGVVKDPVGTIGDAVGGLGDAVDDTTGTIGGNLGGSGGSGGLGGLGGLGGN